MPTYEYRCRDCNHELETQQAFTDDPLTECPSCGGLLKKKFSRVGISFKGSGFYKTDSRSTTSSSRAGDSAGSSSTSSSSSSSSDTGSSSSDSASSTSSGANGSSGSKGSDGSSSKPAAAASA